MFGVDVVFRLLLFPACSIIREQNCSRSFVGESSVCSIARVHICSRCVHFQLSEFELAIDCELFQLAGSFASSIARVVVVSELCVYAASFACISARGMRSHELEANSNAPRLGYYSHSRPRLHPLASNGGHAQHRGVGRSSRARGQRHPRGGRWPHGQGAPHPSHRGQGYGRA